MARTAPRGGRKEPSRAVAISKALSFILRHAAEREGVKLDKQGFASLQELVSQSGYSICFVSCEAIHSCGGHLFHFRSGGGARVLFRL